MRMSVLEQLQIEDWPEGTHLALLVPKPHLRSLWLSFKHAAEASPAWRRRH